MKPSSSSGAPTFCVLEQGRHVGMEVTERKKRMFGDDFYPFNWYTDDDPLADWCADPDERTLYWSEGRSLLFDRVTREGSYDYYIFLDEDIDFEPRDDVRRRIERFLSDWRPLAGTVNSTTWSRMDQELLAEGPRCIAAHDLCVHIFQRDLAEMVFPTWYHGSHGSMWYAQWMVNRTFPRKQMVAPGLEALNTLHGAPVNPGSQEYVVTRFDFERCARPGEFIHWTRRREELNEEARLLEPDPSPVAVHPRLFRPILRRRSRVIEWHLKLWWGRGRSLVGRAARRLGVRRSD